MKIALLFSQAVCSRSARVTEPLGEEKKEPQRKRKHRMERQNEREGERDRDGERERGRKPLRKRHRCLSSTYKI